MTYESLCKHDEVLSLDSGDHGHMRTKGPVISGSCQWTSQLTINWPRRFKRASVQQSNSSALLPSPEHCLPYLCAAVKLICAAAQP
eukprot:1160223-Pelagomonas_calceolata.AAC.3